MGKKKNQGAETFLLVIATPPSHTSRQSGTWLLYTKCIFFFFFSLVILPPQSMLRKTFQTTLKRAAILSQPTRVASARLFSVSALKQQQATVEAVKPSDGKQLCNDY